MSTGTTSAACPASGNAKQVDAVVGGALQAPRAKASFDETTFTVSYVVSDAATEKAAVIDSVWDFDHASGASLLVGFGTRMGSGCTSGKTACVASSACRSARAYML